MGDNAPPPVAHSARSPDVAPDPYVRHVGSVRHGALERADAMLRYASERHRDLLGAIDSAATFHDLGKLDPDTQADLRKGRGSKLRWDHIDAGVAHLSVAKDWMAAWLVRAHHAPGLPEKEQHFNQDGLGRRLRGRRRTDDDPKRHDDQIARTNANLAQYLSDHDAAIGPHDSTPRRPTHGLAMRLALSCLVDADHSDTAYFDTGRQLSESPAPRWTERLEALRAYVRALPPGQTETEQARNHRRASFFDACLVAPIGAPMVACEGPVGLGKTTAVAAYLLRRARDEGLRRLIVVAPYTNILTQTADRLREALVLPGELADQVVVEHHHRADFEHEEERELAVLWRAPIVLTTAVGFFETIAACAPSSLRKLHSLPGSAVFVDEAHAALPAKLWPQNWRWLIELAEEWGCRFVFASGSLTRFWENDDIVGTGATLPELLSGDQATDVLAAERHRIRYARLADGRVLTVPELIDQVHEVPGPRVVILNTVQNAAVVARAMKSAQMNVLHLSTALTPRDRGRIMRRIVERLNGTCTDWTLVATSCVEAGVDFSFRSGFRERFAVASTIQLGGRVNRHGELDSLGGGIVYDFALTGDGITEHPAARMSSDVLREFMVADLLNVASPSDVVTRAMREELSLLGGLGSDQLAKAERARNYPEVSKCAQVIDADTRLVVVEQEIKDRLSEFQPVGFLALLRGSVQLWATRVDELALDLLPGRRELYAWNHSYDPEFLGIMDGILRTQAFLAAGGGAI